MRDEVSIIDLLKLVLELQLLTLKEIRHMSNDFGAMSAAVDLLTAEIAEAVALLQNPVVDNNDQATIDGITARLSGAADALKAALPVPAPASEPAPATTSDASASAPTADEAPADPAA